MDVVGRTLLIVDDESFIRDSFRDYFEDNGWLCLLADSAEAALEMLAYQRPDCAIVDIRMGGMTGDEFIRLASEASPNLVFAICTGSPEFDDAGGCRNLPRVADKIFRKPVGNLADLETELIELIRNNTVSR